MTVNFQESDNLPKRLPKKPIYIHVEAEDAKKCQLSGKFNFHSVNNNAAAFVRDGDKLKTFDPYPYILGYTDDGWYIQDIDSFLDEVPAGWMMLATKGFLQQIDSLFK